MHIQSFAAQARQRGVSTLVVAIVLLIAATFLTFFAAKVGIQEQRMSANDYRHKEAFSTAEAGLDRAKAFLAANRQEFADWDWTDCTGTETDPPCGDGTNNLYNGGWSWINVFSQGVADYATNYLDGLHWPASTRDGPFILMQSVASTVTPTTSFQPVVLVAQAESEDGTGRAVVRQSMTRYMIAQPGPVPPLMAPSINIGGAFNLVGNPDFKRNPFDPGSGVTTENCDSMSQVSGIPLSMWSRNDLNADTSGTANWRTCLTGDFRRSSDDYGSTDPQPCFLGTADNGCGCQPNASADSPYSGKGAKPDPHCPTVIPGAQVPINCDIVQNDPDFPDDPFQYVFGRSPELVKSQADQVLTSCVPETLGPQSSGLIWVDGSCDLAGIDTIGSRSTPVVLVVANGAIKFPAGGHFWGMVVGHNVTEVQINGTFTLHGAMIVDNDVADLFKGNGTYNAVYDPCVFAAMGAGSAFDQYGPVAGSWNDSIR